MTRAARNFTLAWTFWGAMLISAFLGSGATTFAQMLLILLLLRIPDQEIEAQAVLLSRASTTPPTPSPCEALRPPQNSGQTPA